MVDECPDLHLIYTSSKTCQTFRMFAPSRMIDPSQTLDQFSGDAIFSALLVSLCSAASLSLSLQFALHLSGSATLRLPRTPSF